ncbi:hypothetical protein [Streptomyces sp. PsTaAH-124]|uniref:hypothetical protein n=1 Tax=Streptomyces sp. PsTaAH-124 TaxID=1157638 RepID=UPI001319C10D|nr:hypothetical protein [Streptomyces sp. PsTaAH-124]
MNAQRAARGEWPARNSRKTIALQVGDVLGHTKTCGSAGAPKHLPSRTSWAVADRHGTVADIKVFLFCASTKTKSKSKSISMVPVPVSLSEWSER